MAEGPSTNHSPFYLLACFGCGVHALWLQWVMLMLPSLLQGAWDVHIHKSFEKKGAECGKEVTVMLDGSGSCMGKQFLESETSPCWGDGSDHGPTMVIMLITYEVSRHNFSEASFLHRHWFSVIFRGDASQTTHNRTAWGAVRMSISDGYSVPSKAPKQFLGCCALISSPELLS